MKIERRGNVLIAEADGFTSLLRIERHPKNRLLIGLAGRDVNGEMKIESVIFDRELLDKLPVIK